jgi:hypothetical protein
MVLAMFGMLLCSSVSDAGTYEVTVTRKATDLYKVDGTSFYVETRYCYEYAYSEEAILKYTSDYGYRRGFLLFLDSERSYDIAEVYSEVTPASGTKILTAYGELEDVDVLLVPTKLD